MGRVETGRATGGCEANFDCPLCHPHTPPSCCPGHGTTVHARTRAVALERLYESFNQAAEMNPDEELPGEGDFFFGEMLGGGGADGHAHMNGGNDDDEAEE